VINAGKLVGVVGGSCSNSAVSVAATSGNSASLGVLITDNTKQWTCSSLTVNNAGTGVNLDFSFGYVAPSLTLAPLKVTGAVTFTTLPTITVSGYNIGGATNTVYPLMAWSGSSVAAPSVTVTGLGSITAHTTVTGTTPNFTLNLVIDTNLEPLTWAVGGSGFWDTNTANWTDGGGATVTYSEATLPGNQVVFSDASLSADATVTLTNTLNPASVTVNNSAYNYTFSGSGAVAGGASLTKSGTKTLTLLTNNTYTGGTTINGGTLQVGNGGTTGSLGSGPVIDNGTLNYNFGSDATLSLPSGTAISGSGNISVSAGLMKINGNIILGGSHSYTQNGAWSSVAYTKGMEVTADATLRGSALSLIAEIGKRDSNGNNLTLDTSSANGPINLNVSFGRANLWYNLNSFTANAGTGPITIFGANANNSQSMQGSYSLSGGLNIQSSLIGYVFSAPAPTINLRATAASIVSGNVTLGGTANNFNVDTNVTMVVSGVLGGTAAPLMKQGAGTLVLSAKNTYTGGTTVNNGTLSLLGSLTNSSVSTIGAGAFIEAVTGSIAGNGVSFTQGSTGSSLFGGANTYTGGTTVSNGTLTVSSASSLGSNSATTVSGGTLAFEVVTGGRVISNNLVLAGGTVFGGYRPVSGSGGIITSDGSNVRHTFTDVGNSTLTFSATVSNVSGVVVGGGGGAGGQQSGISWLAGGAGGQVTSFTNVSFASGATTITVGGGGAYNVANTQKGGSGGNSSIGTYTSGGMYSATGGFGGGSSNGTYVAGQGGTSPGNIINGVLQAGSPFAGGARNSSTMSGGGAGAGAVGASGITGNGGIGVAVDRFGLFGGGGNGAGGTTVYGTGATAYGGGTQGNGLASTGGGGGALGGNAPGGNGGSGVVIIQYPYTDYAAGTLTLAGSISVQSNSTVNVYAGGTIVISGAMTNTANLTQIGSGSLLIDGTVTGGVITVSSGVFGGTGVVSGTVTNWAALTAGATNTLGTLIVKNLVMTENSSVTWNFDSTTSDVIQVSGTLTLPTVATVNVSRVSGTWPTNPSVLFNVTGSVQGAPSLSNWVVTGDCRPGTKVVLQDNQVLIGMPRGTFVRFY
jgi:autotransporter-associated beta strand protein